MTKKIVFYTNICTPYRTEFFNYLNQFDLSFSVWYQRASVPYRKWNYSDFFISHHHFVNDGLFIQLGSFPLFFNPSLIYKSIRTQPQVMILGLSWNDLDAILLIFLKKVGILNSELIFWSEANYLTNGARRVSIFKSWFRKLVYNQCSFHVSSGKMTQLTLDRWGVLPQKFIPLPNVIQESVFDSRTHVGSSDTLIHIIISARLVERLKGILNFLESIPHNLLLSFHIKIAGSGPDFPIINNYIVTNNLAANVSLLGELTPDELAYQFSISDLFCLPSFSDPSPLSIFEAMCSSLPLLVSNRCGNHYESVIVDENGYLIDPDNPQSIIDALNNIIINRDHLRTMGELSKTIYTNNLSKQIISSRFIDALKSTFYDQ